LISKNIFSRLRTQGRFAINGLVGESRWKLF